MKKDIILIWTLSVLLCLIGKADARIWYVHPDSTLNSIQTGLNSCSANDTVLVAPGIYQENIFWSLLNGIKLFGEYGADSTLIDGNSFSCVIYFSGMANIDTTTIIKGFTIQNGGSVPNGGGICLINSSPKIENNIIKQNSANYGGGIYCGDSSYPIITENTIFNCSAPSGGGIYCARRSCPIITGNKIDWNSPGGIYCIATDTNIIISYNQISNHSRFAIDCGGAPKITNNQITDNLLGGIVCWYAQAEPIITTNTITGNSGFGGIVCYDCSPRIINNKIKNNPGSGIECYWGNCEPTIIGNRISGNQGSGIYCEEYANPTISDDTIIGNQKSGILSIRWSRPSIIGNIITGNSADSGAGIFGSASQIVGNQICSNQTFGNGGGIYCIGAPTISYNTIEGNNACRFGDGIYCLSCSALITNNNIYNNGCGVYNRDNSGMLNAEYNWWGDPTGPYHPALNPDGLGDSTNMFVDPVPFLIDSALELKEENLVTKNLIIPAIEPNPFKDIVTIQYQLPKKCNVNIVIYDLLGKKIKTLVNNKQNAGRYTKIWDGKDDFGNLVSNGVYFLRFQTENHNLTRRLLKIK